MAYEQNALSKNDHNFVIGEPILPIYFTVLYSLKRESTGAYLIWYVHI